MTSQLASTNFWEFTCWLFGRRQRFQISGRSMIPLLQPGDQVLVRPCTAKEIFPGDIVLVGHPYQSEMVMVKLVESIQPDGSLFLLSLNSDPTESTDSRTWGAVPPDKVQGVVTSKL